MSQEATFRRISIIKNKDFTITLNLNKILYYVHMLVFPHIMEGLMTGVLLVKLILTRKYMF